MDYGTDFANCRWVFLVEFTYIHTYMLNMACYTNWRVKLAGVQKQWMDTHTSLKMDGQIFEKGETRICEFVDFHFEMAYVVLLAKD